MSRTSASEPPLDLSTCDNPQGWPVPPLPSAVWQRLPAHKDGLEAAAASYYGNRNLLPVAGVQGAIRMLPHLFPAAMVAAIGPLEDRHAKAWQSAGHRLRILHNATLTRAVAAATPFVLFANPNPVTAGQQARVAAVDAAKQLKMRGGWLIVDESLADPLPELSVATLAGSAEAPNLIVLRSLDAFFGLAGMPAAFVLAAPDLLARLAALLDPWPLAGPGHAVARLALADTDWQANARKRLAAAGQRLGALLATCGAVTATPLYATLTTPQAPQLHENFARHGILTRRFEQPDLLRCGLPGGDGDWQRHAGAVDDWNTR